MMYNKRLEKGGWELKLIKIQIHCEKIKIILTIRHGRTKLNSASSNFHWGCLINWWKRRTGLLHNVIYGKTNAKKNALARMHRSAPHGSNEQLSGKVRQPCLSLSLSHLLTSLIEQVKAVCSTFKRSTIRSHPELVQIHFVTIVPSSFL